MKFFALRKDGGPESRVTGFFIAEIKSLFSIVLLRFDTGSREAYHSHAFNALSWVLRGKLVEYYFDPAAPKTWVQIAQDRIVYGRSIRPVLTPRSRCHKVVSLGTTWVLSFRGPWAREWKEYDPKAQVWTTLTNGRKVVNAY